MRSRLFLYPIILIASGSGAFAELTPRLVKDINTIPQPASSSPSSFLTVGGISYFIATDGNTGQEL